jgi:hypothetical protein
MKRQQFPDGPATIRDASGHGRRRHPSVPETRVRCAEVIHGPAQTHAVLGGVPNVEICHSLRPTNIYFNGSKTSELSHHLHF